MSLVLVHVYSLLSRAALISPKVAVQGRQQLSSLQPPCAVALRPRAQFPINVYYHWPRS